jgi:hypothetical protein
MPRYITPQGRKVMTFNRIKSAGLQVGKPMTTQNSETEGVCLQIDRRYDREGRVLRGMFSVRYLTTDPETGEQVERWTTYDLRK